jgi:hypothetical protein
VAEKWSDEALYRILCALPEAMWTWKQAEALGEGIDSLYWVKRHIHWINGETELLFAIEKLLLAHRAAQAIILIGRALNKDLPHELLLRTLAQAAQEPWASSENMDLGSFRHSVVEIFKKLDSPRTGVSAVIPVAIEFAPDSPLEEEGFEPSVPRLRWGSVPLAARDPTMPHAKRGTSIVRFGERKKSATRCMRRRCRSEVGTPFTRMLALRSAIARCISVAQRTASTTLANSTSGIHTQTGRLARLLVLLVNDCIHGGIDLFGPRDRDLRHLLDADLALGDELGEGDGIVLAIFFGSQSG